MRITARAKKENVVAALTALALTAWGQQPVDLDAILAKDSERWSGTKTATEQYRAAPAAWASLSEPTLPYTLSFPCKPTKTLLEMGGQMVPMFFCRVNHRLYIARIRQKEMPHPMVVQTFYAAIESSLLDELAQEGAQPNFKPIRRITYQNLSGRDLAISTNKTELNARNLVAGDWQVTMSVRGPARQRQEDEVFFNTLKPH